MATTKKKVGTPADVPVPLPASTEPVIEPDTTPAEATLASVPEVPPTISIFVAVPRAAEEELSMEESLMALLTPLNLPATTLEALSRNGFDSVESLTGLTASDLASPSVGVPLGHANRIMKAIAASSSVPATPTASAIGTVSTAPIMELLPTVPDGEPWLAALKVGGQLKKATTTDVVAGMRVSIASSAGLFDLPARLVKLMDDYMESQDEPAGLEYIELRRELLKRRYTDVLQALGVPAELVTEASKRELVDRVNTYLWPAFSHFFTMVKEWAEVWQQTAPNMALNNLLMVQGGGVAMPIQPPDTAHLHDAADAINDRLNKVFAKLGIPAARALAAEAQRTLELLDTPGLMAAVGVTNRDQLLKAAGIDVNADLVRMERSIARFAVAVLALKDVAPGQTEWQYLMGLVSLGSTIPWDRLTNSSTKERRTSGSGFPSPGGIRV